MKRRKLLLTAILAIENEDIKDLRHAWINLTESQGSREPQLCVTKESNEPSMQFGGNVVEDS